MTLAQEQTPSAVKPPRNHAVRFYQDETGLVKHVSTHLAEGLRNGETAVLIATRPHGKAISEALRTQGLDPAALSRSGDYHVYDAEEMLGRILTQDHISSNRFDLALQALLDRLREKERHPRFRVYGEMVDLLWQRGQLSAAIYLEACWNRLLERQAFSLLCAYRLSFLEAGDSGAAIDAVCRTHSHVGSTHPERLERAIDRATEILFGVDDARSLKRLIVSTLRPSGWPRGGEAGALWIRQNLPEKAGPLLALARSFYDGVDVAVPPSALKRSPAPPVSILLAEDDDDDVFILRHGFGKAEPHAILQIVRNGEEAIAYLEGRAPYHDRRCHPKPDLVLLDLKLPRKNGFEILEWLRSRPATATLPVVIHSSSQESSDVERAYRLGANAYLGKEIDMRGLFEMARGLAAFARIRGRGL